MSVQHAKQQQQSLGEEFRLRRQEMNLSLKEVEAATSIRMNHLEAIERGEISQLISPVYARGFVEQYAIFLGLNTDDCRKQVASLFPRQEQSTQSFAYGIGSVEMRNSPGQGVKWLPSLMWIAGFGILLGAAWAFASYLGLL